MDKINLNQLQFYGYHGLFSEEQKLGQRFEVDLELYLDLKKAGKSDRMEDSIHYGEVYNAVQRIVEGEPKQLIEAVAEDIASQLLRDFQILKACRVIVIKPNPPIHGHYHSVSVEIYREKNNE
jgi:dihydroneopterin aldolase